MKCIDISIIVPIYNCEIYLHECLDSLVNQDYSNYEIVLINDGSTDNSLEICKKYQKKYSKITLYDKKNEGVSVTRNFGISKSKGKYIFFVDSDDVIQTNTLTCMMDMLKSTKSDIAICNVKNFKEKYEIDDYDNNKNIVYDKKDFFYQILKFNYNTFNCGILVPKEYFENVIYPKNRYFEDLATMYYLYNKADKIVCNPVKLYKYRDNPTSIVHTASKKKAKDYIMAANEMINFLKKHYTFDKNIINTYLCNVYLTLYIYYKDEEALEKLKKLRKDINIKDMSLSKKLKLLLLKYSLGLTKIIMKIK